MPSTDIAGRYKMGTMVRLTGFSPALLRAWERRHKILKPVRGVGGHRMYTDEDLLVLRHVRRLIDQGRSIGEISSAGREELLAAAQESATSLDTPSPTLDRPATNGGHAESGRLTQSREAIVEAALAMDGERIEDLMDQVFATVTPDAAIHQVIEPAALHIGKLWAEGRCTVASEHLASGIFVHRLRKLLEAANSRGSAAARVVFSCFPDENHDLGLLILAYHFSRFGWRVSYLGPALPFEDLERALDVLKPRAVVLSVTREALYFTHKPRMIELLKRRSDQVAFFIGGQGAPEDDQGVRAAGGDFCPNGRPAPERVRDLLGRTQN